MALDSGCRFPVTITTVTFCKDEVLVGDTFRVLADTMQQRRNFAQKPGLFQWPALAHDSFPCVEPSGTYPTANTVLSERPSNVYDTKNGM